MDELHVLVLSGPQDFCDVKRGSIWIFSEQLCPDLLIPKIREKEYCSILIHRDAMVFYCNTTPLNLPESKHASLWMLGPVTIVPRHCLFW